MEGLINVKGISELIRKNQQVVKNRNELIFMTIKEICTNSEFSSHETIKRIELAVRVALAMITDGVLVAPTEGMQGISHFRNPDNSDYIAVSYAGPIRSAGGTAVALSVAFADYARRFFSIGDYRATPNEIERYVEELEIYHERVTPLQYRPPADEIRTIVSNCPVCVDGVPTEEVEISVHANMSRRGFDGKDVAVTNRIRGGIPLVVSSIAQKAKSVSREVRKAGLDWSWLDGIIKLDKVKAAPEASKDETAVFLDELVAGRPILAYPKHFGGFRLRYGRSRMTGIAAKGFSPATMAIVDDFIAIGTQLKIELPGKGCVASPVDSIEGPFVKLKSGESLRINDAETARLLRNRIGKIICLGDVLITYGDFKKSNTKLQPSGYVEEFWEAQLRDATKEMQKVDHANISFEEAYAVSMKYRIPLHPKFLFEFQAVDAEELELLASAILPSLAKSKTAREIEGLKIQAGDGTDGTSELDRILDMLMVPHAFANEGIEIRGDYAKALITSLGFTEGSDLGIRTEGVMEKYKAGYDDTLSLVNSVSQVKLMKRSIFLGARIGRPEKAKERLMKPALNILFPIGFRGGKERNLSNAYIAGTKKFGSTGMDVEIASYRCDSCGLAMDTPYCYSCKRRCRIDYRCPNCGIRQETPVCRNCGAETRAYDERGIDFEALVSKAMQKIGVDKMPKSVKGVKGLVSRKKIAEPVEKGILRSMHGVYIFKDGTARFDATDMPITHFYPKEVGVSAAKLRELGYDKDYEGKELASENQLLELKHQDVIVNKRGGEYLLAVSRFVDDMLQRLYGMGAYYRAKDSQDLIGKLVLSLSPHTSCAVLNRIVGFTEANVGFAHPYVISARRRNADGDEDTIMLLLDALINFSREYLPVTIGGTMDEPLLMMTRVMPQEVDDEVHAMEVVNDYGIEFYSKTFENASPDEAKVELVKNRLETPGAFHNLSFTHAASANAIRDSPKSSIYTILKTMDEKIDEEFKVMDMLESIDKRDAARRLINGHFIRDLIGNLHSFSKQRFRCSSCNAKYRRVPLSGKCTRNNCGGKLLLTISKGSIEKYLNTSIKLADRYNLDTYTKQRLQLIKDEIGNLFGAQEVNADENKGQFNLVNFM